MSKKKAYDDPRPPEHVKLMDEIERLIRSRERGRPLKLQRLLSQNDPAQGAMVGSTILSRFRGDNPTGIKAQLLRMIALRWIESNKILGIEGGPISSHIGYEFLIQDAMERREWNEAMEWARKAHKGKWCGDWEGILDFCQRRIDKRRRV